MRPVSKDDGVVVEMSGRFVQKCEEVFGRDDITSVYVVLPKATKLVKTNRKGYFLAKGAELIIVSYDGED